MQLKGCARLSAKIPSVYSVLAIEPPFVAPNPPEPQPPHNERGMLEWLAVMLFSKRLASWESVRHNRAE